MDDEHDPLTEAWREEALMGVAGAALAEREAAWLALLEVVGLREIDRGHGKAAGDKVLRAVGRMLATYLRDEGMLARLPDRSFGVLLRDRDSNAARAVVQRLLAAVAEVEVVDLPKVSVVARAGLAASAGHRDASAWLDAARADLQRGGPVSRR